MFEEIIKTHIVARVNRIPSSAKELANEEEYRKILVDGKALYREHATLWLAYDRWTKEEAARLLSGLLPSNDPGALFFDQTYYLQSEKNFRVRWLLLIFLRNFQCLDHVIELLDRSPFRKSESPKVWAEYAGEKELLPPRDCWADIDNSPLLSLLAAKDTSVSKRETESGCPESKVPYSTAWMAIQKGAIAQFFNPRRNIDPKSEEVVEWIIKEAAKAGLKESRKIAGAIFTMIKPYDHQPRKRRDNPL